jgi:hypothetical protein
MLLPETSPLGRATWKGVALETSHRPVMLAVEDEPLILMLAVDKILDAGFEPLWASNAGRSYRYLGEPGRYQNRVHRH